MATYTGRKTVRKLLVSDIMLLTLYAAKITLGGRGHPKLFLEYMTAQPGITLGVRELDIAACSIMHDVNDCQSFVVRLVRDVVQLSS